MQYQDYDYANPTDEAPWTAPPAVSTPTDAENYSQLLPLTPNPLAPTNGQAPATAPETVMLNSLIQSVLQTQTQQMYLLRNLDARLARLEETPRLAVHTQPQTQAFNAGSFERATWWAIWGLLMLVLGGALAVVLLLILLNLQFR
ncbi:MAG: hypothetical protein HY741_01965 [Chloroflexi bacterium]|nr:hypothetical protein [Chloroflexota bacterium]